MVDLSAPQKLNFFWIANNVLEISWFFFDFIVYFKSLKWLPQKNDAKD